MVSIRSFVSGSNYQIAVEARHPHFVLVGPDTLDFFMIHTMIINRLLNQCLLETVQDRLSMSYLTLSFFFLHSWLNLIFGGKNGFSARLTVGMGSGWV
mmetsp:Transcript_222/g.327  ORF Transcript_222/g.327 Transcript_222/m.327 type:complete len:98 (+) Transcript_222:43-336(+)